MMIKEFVLVCFLIATGIAVCQPRAVGIWLALAQGGYDTETMRQMQLMRLKRHDDDDEPDQKRYNP